ncbi:MULTISPECIES: hypothetical protein [unclassified Streptomyces]|uniref:hypothetical protein n=1 Tax=unclassified Streptomyces TaxID=2593676 RepID=UPI00341BD8BF
MKRSVITALALAGLSLSALGAIAGTATAAPDPDTVSVDACIQGVGHPNSSTAVCEGGTQDGKSLLVPDDLGFPDRPSTTTMRECVAKGGTGITNNGHGGMVCNGGELKDVFVAPARYRN